MPLEPITDPAALDQRLDDPDRTILVAFFGEFSEASRSARPAFEAFCAAHPEQQVVLVDVGITKGLHTRFGVTSVPTVVAFRGGRVQRSIVGAQSAEYYARAFLGESAGPKRERAERAHRVTVYVTNTCPWCTRVKTYLREKKVVFDEINVSNDESAARRMVQRSGQQGVPQLDIDGAFVVGFDKSRIDALLGLGRGNA